MTLAAPRGTIATMDGYASLAGLELGPAFPVRLVGVINVSPESFYPGSIVPADERALVERARQMIADGAELIDVGAMSTAPYRATAISADEECRRMEWAVRTLAASVSTPISADTRRAVVAAAALAAGARVINDTSGLRADPAMADVAAQAEGLILMAWEEAPSSEAPIDRCRRLLRASLEHALRAGLPAERIAVDPGIGFFRHGPLPWDQWDIAVLRDLAGLLELGRPILIGVSRKSFLGKATGRTDPAERLFASLAATAVAVINGAAAVRTHDVGPTRDAVRVAEQVRRR